MTTETPATQDLPYAVPVPRTGTRVWAGVAITLAGLGLVVLGGCFLIGVMMTLANGFGVPRPLSGGQKTFVGFLSGLSFICFVAAAFVLVAGFRGLFRILRG
jgi:hypothetical protein